MSPARDLPDPLTDAVGESLRRAAVGGGRIVEARPIGGGCINPSRRVVTEDRSDFFLKWNDDELPGLFGREAEGLRALREATLETPIRVPEVIAVGGDGEGARSGFLLLEFVPGGSPDRNYGRDLGEGLAALHRGRDEETGPTEVRASEADGSGTDADGSSGADRDDASDAARDDASRADVDGTEAVRPRTWGWETDNWIGSLPQSNGPREDWAEFWWEERIRPQWERARRAGHLDSDGDDRLLERVEHALPGVLEPVRRDGPSLLHGDLWSGNVYPGPEGEPVLIDPAVYRGHREVDLAMAELFGGFPAEFLPAYRTAWPLADGYQEGRRAAYQLYPLLVHVNLFGSGYASRARAAAGTVAKAGG